MSSQPISLPDSAAITRRAPGLFASLNQRDRRLLFACLAIVAVLIVIVALVAPQEDDSDTTPSSFATTSHGAKAAYLALAQSGYRIERWGQPLDQLAAQSDAHTVLILAEPYFGGTEAARAPIAKILERGGRVLATGITGAALLPNNHAAQNPQAIERECEAQPEGLAALADSGAIHIRPLALWHSNLPEQRVQYTCNGNAVVVSYAAGKGEVIWWANSLPLENAGITRDGNLALLLRSIDPSGRPDAERIVWDESLHEDDRGLWSYASGTPVHLLWAQLAVLALLLVLSYSRRSGPLLPDPVIARDTQLEFVHSLGALYDKASATNTAVKIAFDRFRLLLGRQTGAPRPGTTAAERSEEIVSQINARRGAAVPGLQPEIRNRIQDCEEAAYASEPISPRHALALVRSLWEYEEQIRQGGKKNPK